jgi:hypothetical protein
MLEGSDQAVDSGGMAGTVTSAAKPRTQNRTRHRADRAGVPRLYSSRKAGGLRRIRHGDGPFDRCEWLAT